jgi:hydrogenase 3 maturation protease
MNLLLGIGNPRHGDDALGPIFARAFRHPDWQCINTSTVPENYTGVVRRLHPEILVFLDAADMGTAPGTLRRLPPESIQMRDFGTHAPPLGQLAGFLSDCADEIIILGIQPETTRPGARLSAPIRATLKALGDALARNQIP